LGEVGAEDNDDGVPVFPARRFSRRELAALALSLVVVLLLVEVLFMVVVVVASSSAVVRPAQPSIVVVVLSLFLCHLYRRKK